MAILHNVLIFGGTFDPVHQGHLQTAITIQKFFNFEHVLFLPCKTPVLKDKASASAQQRVAMLTLALEEVASQYPFAIDERELQRDSPSYMVTTLQDFRKQWTDNRSISLLLGLDTFYQLPKWHQWQQLLKLCNLLVIDRPGVSTQAPDEITLLLKNHFTDNSARITQERNGLITRFNAGHYDLSSSTIRKNLLMGKNVDKQLPESVYQYILKHSLYKI